MTKTLVYAHVYYPEMWDELADCVAAAPSPFDLYVTIVRESPDLEQKVKSRFPAAQMIVCEYKGFDIAPFFKVLNTVDLDDYAYVVKLHTKRDMKFTMYVNGRNVWQNTWRELLLSPFKSKENWQKTLNLLARDDIGMVADGGLILNKRRDGNGKLYKKAAALMKKLGLSVVDTDFVAGTMFAAKAPLFKCLKNRDDLFEFQPSERGGKDVLPYVCERLFGMIVSAQSKKIAALNDDMASVKRRWLMNAVLRFFFYKKVSEKKTLVKICKIPVWAKRAPNEH